MTEVMKWLNSDDFLIGLCVGAGGTVLFMSSAALLLMNLLRSIMKEEE